ncbi:MAG: hypothetical protein NWE98_02225 [Candidatus Bathyarchaeota archaeon]|nr:hypothetical protein [Candidatus Bathyarchaeota archaeon]
MKRYVLKISFYPLADYDAVLNLQRFIRLSCYNELIEEMKLREEDKVE